MRILVAVAAAACLAPPLCAQELSRPAAWHVRFDDPTATEAQLEMFVSMPPGWHITTGPAAIFWDPAITAEGDYRAELEVFLFDPEGRQEAFGIFVGGADVEGTAVSYLYFVIRDGGQFLIKERRGADTFVITDWTAHPAIRSYVDRGDDASVKNALAVDAAADRVRFFVNEQEVAVLPRTQVHVDGTAGLRVNHRLNLHVSRWEVTQSR